MKNQTNVYLIHWIGRLGARYHRLLIASELRRTNIFVAYKYFCARKLRKKLNSLASLAENIRLRIFGKNWERDGGKREKCQTHIAKINLRTRIVEFQEALFARLFCVLVSYFDFKLIISLSVYFLFFSR